MNVNRISQLYNFNYIKEKTEMEKYKWKECTDSFDGFLNVCRLTEMELKKYLHARLKEFFNPETIVNDEGFLYVKGNLPVLVTAHMDTVHVKQCKKFYVRKENKQHIVTSPNGIGGDDRCGIHMILKLLEKGYRPYVLFCEQEEIGGVGSNLFCQERNLIREIMECKYLIELDRTNGNDAVFYDCENPDFTDYICKTTGYKEAFGSFSDISHLSPACKVASVNLSCGYYKAHTTNEYVNIEEMNHTIEVVEKLFSDIENVEQFEYIERYEYFNRYSLFNGNSRYSSYGIDDFEYYDELEEQEWMFVFLDMGKEICKSYEGRSYYECLGQLMFDYGDLTYNKILDECRIS